MPGAMELLSAPRDFNMGATGECGGRRECGGVSEAKIGAGPGERFGIELSGDRDQLGGDPVVSVTADADGFAIGFDEVDAVGQGRGEAAIVDAEVEELGRMAGSHDFGGFDGAAGFVLGTADNAWKCDRDSWSSHTFTPKSMVSGKGAVDN